MWHEKEILVTASPRTLCYMSSGEHHLIYLHFGHFICNTEVSTQNNTSVLSSCMMDSVFQGSDAGEGQCHLRKDHFKRLTSVWSVVWLLFLLAVFHLPFKEFMKHSLKDNTWERIKKRKWSYFLEWTRAISVAWFN